MDTDEKHVLRVEVIQIKPDLASRQPDLRLNSLALGPMSQLCLPPVWWPPHPVWTGAWLFAERKHWQKSRHRLGLNSHDVVQT